MIDRAVTRHVHARSIAVLAAGYLVGLAAYPNLPGPFLGIFLIASTIGNAMEAASLRGPSPAPGLVVVAALCGLVLFVRRRRLRRWRETPLVFDDELPVDVQALRLR
jgi:hypothetical protein